jgi:hypothetical protein
MWSFASLTFRPARRADRVSGCGPLAETRNASELTHASGRSSHPIFTHS